MNLAKLLFPPQLKFTPASSEVNWTHVNTLVHGPGAGVDHSSVNSAVFACLMAISTAYPEPPLTVFKRDRKGNSEKIPEHPLQELLNYPSPNGELSMEEMLFWTAWAKHIDGNAYWLKVRSGNNTRGNVVELWPISPTVMRPKSEGGDWISYYEWQMLPGKRPEQVPVENVIHFRLGLDDKDMRLGLAPLKALLRQIATDDEADKFVAALLKNYAVPGLVVIPGPGTNVSEDDANRISEKLSRKFGNDNRGNIAVMSKESDIKQFGFSPKDLDMSILHRIPEERISAVMQVPAIVAGLGAGLDRATYANFKEAREMFTEQKLIPQWRADGKKLDTSLKPDFTSDPLVYVSHDLTDVRALQEDEDSKYNRLSVAVNKPFMTRNEARSDIGLDPVDSWDEEDIAKPEPVPAPLQEGNQAQDEPPAGEEPAKSALAVELRRWQRFAAKRVEAGSPEDAAKFASDLIPQEQAEAIRANLLTCKSAEDVRAVFAASSKSDFTEELRRTNALLEQLTGG